MRHVIAGETQGDTIEWRLVMKCAIPVLEGRKVGSNDWLEVAWVVESKFVADKDEFEYLGLTEIDLV